MNKLQAFCLAVAAAVVNALLANPLLAQTPTLPDVGVDTAGYITAGITGFGLILLVAVGGFFAFKLVMLGVKLVRMAFGRG